ncbi:hypothetical protein CD798_14595 [Bacillaceae bacterium SAOS 7]|nr:hypothetical protein CD798_14595 [Bacillaceae bacterium SAOS 7]
MVPTFTLATWFWLLVPMPLLIVFSIISLLNQIRYEKKQRSSVISVNETVPYQKTVVGKKGS